MQAELYVSKASLVYGESSRTASGYTEKPQLEKKILLLSLHVCICVHIHAHVCVCVQVSMETSDPWELELKASVNHPTPVLMAEHHS